jgi:polysaccharide export outer membrane protein
MKNWVYLLAAILLLSFSASVQAQGSAPKKVENEKVLSARSLDVQPVKAATANPNYLIGADDVLSVDVWKEPELSRTLPVRPDGKISLPLVNDLEAAGVTPAQLASAITRELREVLVNPQVTVIVTQINSRRIYILGEVIHAGAYPLVSDMTVLQALSTAGGLTTFADLNKIYVMRTENERQQMFRFQYKEVISGRKPDQNIQLKPGDTVVVP